MVTVVISEEDLKRSDLDLEELIIHELFHIFTRNNLGIQETLYGIVGFTKCSELENHKSRCLLAELFFTGQVRGHDYQIMPILLSGGKYDEDKGGEFFDYLNFLFVGIDIKDNEVLPLVLEERYMIFPPSEAPHYFELIGDNTNYTIHPEEVGDLLSRST